MQSHSKRGVLDSVVTKDGTTARNKMWRVAIVASPLSSATFLIGHTIKYLKVMSFQNLIEFYDMEWRGNYRFDEGLDVQRFQSGSDRSTALSWLQPRTQSVFTAKIVLRTLCMQT